MSETKFPLHEQNLPFELPKTDKPREKILALGKKITEVCLGAIGFAV